MFLITRFSRKDQNTKSLFSYFKKISAINGQKTNSIIEPKFSDIPYCPILPPFTVSKRELSTIISKSCSSVNDKNIHYLIIEDLHYKKLDVTIKLKDSFSLKQYSAFYPSCPFQFQKNVEVAVIGTPVESCFDLSRGTENYIICRPRHFISVTSVPIATKCVRQAVLKDRLPSLTSPNLVMLVGSLGHFLVEYLLSKNLTVSHSACEKSLTQENYIITDHLREIALQYLHSVDILQLLYSSGVTADAVLEKAEALFPSIISYAQKFTSSTLSPESCLVIENCLVNFEIIATEEYFEDDVYGLKGKIDLTAKVLQIKPLENAQPCFNVGDIVPIEIKTGKLSTYGNLDHMAQSMLYSLVVENRYKKKINKSILIYIGGEKTILVTSSKYDIYAFIEARNSLIRGLYDDYCLPDFSEKSDTCRFCPVLNHCHLHAAIEKTTHPHGNVYPPKLCLTTLYLDHDTEEIAFYKMWYSDMIVEINSAIRQQYLDSNDNDNISTQTIKDVIFKGQNFVGQNWILSFSREDQSMNPSAAHALSTNIPIFENSFVVGRMNRVDESTRVVMFTGLIDEIDIMEGTFTVKHDSPLSNDFSIKLMVTSSTKYLPLSFLSQVMVEDSENSNKLRDWIIKKTKTKINTTFALKKDSEEYKCLNNLYNSTISPSHIRAVQHCINAQDYAILWGLPGTGKTTTIAAILYILNKLSKRVLITSHTNAAVDNILLKLINLNIPFLRIGKQQSVHPDIKIHTLENILSKKTEWSMNEFTCIINDQNIYATTCVGVKNQLFNRLKPFDVCIVDEATQVNLPTILGSLNLSNSFILVGDHYQMSPIVLSKRCQFLSKSLFEILMDFNKESMISLDEQFRMNPSICEISSRLFYNNRLQPSELLLHELADKLQLPSFDVSKIDSLNKSWLIRAVSADSHPVVFINSDIVAVHEMLVNFPMNHCLNLEEVSATLDIVNVLCTSGINEKDIGVLCIYSAQADLLEFIMRQRHPNIEVHTVDRFQGRDKLCIIVSFVAKRPISLGSILNNPKRLNVALTRSRKKLFLLGCYGALKDVDNFKNVFSILGENNALILE